ncbi:MAG: flagellar motor protein MotD [Gammaproteobacteria bacterium]|nr:flagellar motor protein MotD [Gammaproteobacteria bacterium]
MARKKKHEEHENLERWLVSYADFITLLFAFFVVMYAISSVNEGKYRVMADSIKSALQNDPRTMAPIKFGDPGLSSEKQKINESERIGKSQSFIDQPNKEEPDRADMVQQVSSSMKALIDKGLISVKEHENWIEIEISNSVLFVSGSARLQPEAVPLLKILSRILNRFPNTIQVEGFTDNEPISNEVFPSNWELSAARSASVVRLFERSGIDSERLSVVGYGQTRPVADNDNARGRERNRRVLLVINKQVERRTTDMNTREQERQAAAAPSPREQEAEVPTEVPLVTPGGDELVIDTETLPQATTPTPSSSGEGQRIFREQTGE